jgi:CubicO group peptidase (beta-lactamase class C family)
MAVAIVKGDDVLLRRGFGYRDSAKKLPVTTQTLFAIGSISKSFTAVGLGILVDQGKLDWKTPVRDRLPLFRLKDPVASDQATPLDLLSHRTGLPRHDFIWYSSGLQRGRILETLSLLEPSREFRESWQYNNLMYLTAGCLDESISGAAWEDLTRSRIFKPLAMVSSNFSVRESQKADDHALPYAKVGSEVRPIRFYNIDALAPAGGINSNVDDMARYLQMHINKGTFSVHRILEEKTAERLQTATMVIDPVDATGLNAAKYEEVGTLSYGLAFFLASYRGRKVVWHSGSIDGFSALFSFLPRERIGVVVLTNLSGHRPVPICITRNAFDRLLGLDPIDWNARAHELDTKAENERKDAEAKEKASRKPGTHPAHNLDAYAGSYEHPAYGSLSIASVGEALTLTWHGETVPLKHRHYETYDTDVAEDDPDHVVPKLRVSFLDNAEGVVDRMALPLEPKTVDVVFTRKAESTKRP